MADTLENAAVTGTQGTQGPQLIESKERGWLPEPPKTPSETSYRIVIEPTTLP
jgi:hypothetical protein